MCEGGVEVARGGDGARLLVELGRNSHDEDHDVDNVSALRRQNCDDYHHLVLIMMSKLIK